MDYATKFILGASVIGIVTEMVAQQDDKYQYAFGATVAITLIFNLVCNLAKKAAAATEISEECEKLEIKWRGLWARVETFEIDEADTRKELISLSAELVEATRRDEEAVLWYHKCLNKKCEKLTEKIMGAELA